MENGGLNKPWNQDLFFNHPGPHGSCHKFKRTIGCTLTVYPQYLLCSLGILGDYNPKIPTI